MSRPASVAIVGGGVAGFTTASALRDLGFDGGVTIVESEPASYDRPPLSKAAFVEGAPLESLAFASPESLAARRIEVLPNAAAVALEPDAGRVVLDDGREVRAEAIVVATGARARRPAFPGADLEGVLTLRTFRDAQAIRRAAQPGARVLVLGAGLIGAELASGLRTLGTDVVLVDRNVVPLARLLGGAFAARLHAMHAEHGVDVRVGGVAAVERAGGRLRATLADGSSAVVDAVVAGLGAEPNAALAVTAGLETADGVVVDREGRASHPGVFAVGDVARRRSSDGTLEPRDEHWEAAQLAAHAVAAAIVGVDPPRPTAAWYWSDRYGIHLEVVGRLVGDGDEVLRDGAPDAVFRVADGVLVGAATIDDPMTVRAARRVIDRRVPVDPARLADPAFELRALLRGG